MRFYLTEGKCDIIKNQAVLQNARLVINQKP
jgi:hypothetical protein